MNGLPAGWGWATLNDLQANEPRAITDGPFGSNLTSAHYSPSGARVIRLQNIGDGKFIDERSYIALKHFEGLRAYEVKQGDVVVASLGQGLPRACLVPVLDAPAIVKADCIRVRLHPEIDAKWVVYALSTSAAREYVAGRMRGVGRPRIGLGEIRKIPIPVAPYPEQRRIVTAIEDASLNLESGLTHLAACETRLESLNRALMGSLLGSQYFKQWNLAALISEKLINGRSVPTFVGGFPVLRLTALRGGDVDLEERKPGAWSLSEAQQYLVRQGDFLVSRGNGSLRLVGRGGLVSQDPERDPVAFPDTMIRVRVDESKMRPQFLALAWNSPQVRRQIERFARTTAGIYKINQAMLLDVALPVPDLAVQDQIIVQYKAAVDEAQRLRVALVSGAQRAAQLRNSILTTSFTGRLLPQRSADEPAAELLARIQAERAAAPPRQRVRFPRTQKELAAPPTRVTGDDYQQEALPL
ncbi:hypothetical protein ABZ356_04765 [Micromonospora zamorensis]|uniref:restriction endonuclease subunit S n=1 Tax=Micromonospora zamorensis TaxID=709883 RepID=UPI0033EBE6A2